MSKISTLADLRSKQAELKAKATGKEKVLVNVSLATCSIASGGKATFEAMKDEVSKLGLTNVEFMQSGCMTFCHSEPTVEITLPGKAPVVFGPVDDTKGREIVEKYIKNGEEVGGTVPLNFDRVVL